jgi:putative tryptophan/tyrosine transport system substrate-binding protein
MKLRALVVVTFGALLSLGSATAQQAGKIPRVGYLQIAPREAQVHLIEAFERGLTERGLVVGRDVLIEYRFADGKPERLDKLADELVRLRVDVIVTGVNPNTRAAQRATKTIPIVMAISYFPVESGLVQSLGRPGGNVTGLVADAGEEGAKRLQILREATPKLTRVAVLSEPGLGYRDHLLKRLESAARSLGIVVVPLEIRGADDIQRVFGEIERAKVDGLMVLGGSVPLANRDRIISMSAKAKLPAIWVDRQIVQDGALLSYGADRVDLFRRAAGYVDRILKGAKPADLPIEQPTKYVLAINLKTAKALGIAIPQTLLLLADHVVE